jgi:cobalt-zinc-cadmium efflux system protein
VIVAGAIIWKTGWTLADPLAGAIIGIIIVAGSWRVIRSSAHILMEGTPACLSLKAIEENMCQSPGVAEVHNLHIWNLCSQNAILSAHVVKDESNSIPSEDMIMDIKLRLKEEFGIEHSTLQLEYKCCDESNVCRTCACSVNGS